MMQVHGPTGDTDDETAEGPSSLPVSGPRSHRLFPACPSNTSAMGPSSLLGRGGISTCAAKVNPPVGKCNIFHAREALAPVAPPDSPSLSVGTLSPREPFT